MHCVKELPLLYELKLVEPGGVEPPPIEGPLSALINRKPCRSHKWLVLGEAVDFEPSSLPTKCQIPFNFIDRNILLLLAVVNPTKLTVSTNTSLKLMRQLIVSELNKLFLGEKTLLNLSLSVPHSMFISLLIKQPVFAKVGIPLTCKSLRLLSPVFQ